MAPIQAWLRNYSGSTDAKFAHPSFEWDDAADNTPSLRRVGRAVRGRARRFAERVPWRDTLEMIHDNHADFKFISLIGTVFTIILFFVKVRRLPGEILGDSRRFSEILGRAADPEPLT